MNIFHKYTRQTLVANRMRTLVTIIGIILSMSMFTAVTEATGSGILYMQRYERASRGNWYGYFENLDRAGVEQVATDKNYASYATMMQVGWADVDTVNEDKPYLTIYSVSDNIEDLLAIHLLEGRMPENEGEILIPDHLNYNGGVTYELGETITLQVGNRTRNGQKLTVEDGVTEGEEITDAVTREYVVVGFCNRLDYNVEGYYSPGYYAITVGEAEDTGYCFFTLKSISGFYRFMANQTISAQWKAHKDLLNYMGLSRNDGLNLMIYGFAAILVLLISVGSISLIYNSFSISVGERTRQFGILKSLGATRKQIRSAVLYEACVLCAIGIPVGMLSGCLGIGITFKALSGTFDKVLGDAYGVSLSIVIMPVALFIAAAICLITTLVAAFVPANRAVKVSAIEAIRQTDTVKLKARSVKTGKLTLRLMGFAGMMAKKNFKRNKKRNRAVVFSLFLSITLFISASSFCSYLRDSVNSVLNGDGNVDISYVLPPEEQVDRDSLLSQIRDLSDVTDAVLYACDSYYLDMDISAMSDEQQKVQASFDSGNGSEYMNVLFLQDREFDRLAKKSGLGGIDFYDQENPVAMLYNRTTLRRDVTRSFLGLQMNYSSWVDTTLLRGDAFPSTLAYQDILPMEHYTYMSSMVNEKGETEYLYYPVEYMANVWSGEMDYDNLDPGKALHVAKADALEITEFQVVGEVKEDLFYVALPTVIYPFSMQESVLSERMKNCYECTEIAVQTRDDTKTYTEIRDILEQERLDTDYLINYAEGRETERLLSTAVNVFAYGFIVLISLISLANVFNTISTNVMLRRREFAMLRSIGLSEKEFKKMMNLECLFYGCKSIAWGLPASVAMTYLIYQVTETAVSRNFYIPWYSVAIAVGSVFVVVFAAMLYASGKIKQDNIIDALKNENL